MTGPAFLFALGTVLFSDRPLRAVSMGVAVLFTAIAAAFGLLVVVSAIQDRTPIRVMSEGWTTEVVADRPIFPGEEIGITRHICVLQEREGLLTEEFRKVNADEDEPLAVLHRPATAIVYGDTCEPITELVSLPSIITPGRWCLHRKVIYLRLLRLPPSRIYTLPTTCFEVTEPAD